MTNRVIAAFFGAAVFISAAPAPRQAPLPEPKAGIANPGPAMASLLSCLHGKTTLVSAHRGGPAPGYPESAMETFAHTLSQAPVLFETDVRTTSDGVLTVMHDDTLDRTSDGHGPVNAMSWDAMSKLHLKDNGGHITAFRVPRLDAILDWMRGRGLIVLDMKDGADTKQVATAIHAAKAEPYTGVIAYSVAQAKDFYVADPDITILYPIESMADFDALRGAGIPDARLVAWMGIDRQQLELWKVARARKIPLAYGTLFYGDYAMTMTNNYSHFAELAKRNIDVLPTDYPVVAYEKISAVKNTIGALRACRALGPVR